MQFIQNNKSKSAKEEDTPETDSQTKKTDGFIGTIWDYPEEIRDNYFIISGYRCGYRGILGGLKTLFLWHNETVNVWTHFVGKLAVWVIVAWILCTFHRPGLEGQEISSKVKHLREQNSDFSMNQFLNNQIFEVDKSIQDSKSADSSTS